MRKRLWIAFFILTLSLSGGLHAQDLSPEGYAYSTYVRCFNLARRIIELNQFEELDREAAWSCTDFALEALDRSKSKLAPRYLAYLNLLDTDGSGAEELHAVIAKRKNMKSNLEEAKKYMANNGSCILPEVSLSRPAKRLCRSNLE